MSASEREMPLFDFRQLISILSVQNPVIMKSAKLITSFLLIVISTSLFTSCTPESLDYSSTTREFISKGQWSVDLFFAGQDKTAQYSGYQFSFIGNGTATATNGVETVSGTWSVATDVNRNEILRINMNSQDPRIQDLNVQWSITDKNNYIIAMKDGSNELRFKKL